MAKNGKQKNGENGSKKEKKEKDDLLSHGAQKWIKAIAMFLAAIVIGLSFFGKAGVAGQWIDTIAKFVAGDSKITIATIVLSLAIGGFVFLKSHKKIKVVVMALAVSALVVGVSGIATNQNLNQQSSGLIGLAAKGITSLFGLLVSNIIFGAILLVSFVMFIEAVWPEKKEEDEKEKAKERIPDVPPLKISGVNTEKSVPEKITPKVSLFQKNNEQPKKTLAVPIIAKFTKGKYSLPPTDLLGKEETAPTSGNIKENSLIIKKTLENFGINVGMSEVNVGPTVTQYAFKPAEGVKLSKITTLSNNLALALAAHPIRIEAPIPGKSLVGVEVPNKVRAMISLRNLIEHSQYQEGGDALPIAIGKDVSGMPSYTDLAEMPHMLVAGATGSGKTIFLNTLILSLLYRHTPETLRIIMVDPKRVEFQHYNSLPHLLCPVVHDATKTINALQWLVREMERRFEVFSEIPARNIKSYNTHKSVIAAGSEMPYIVLVIDELADLMAAKGRELEAGIVRLAQMARATGIHLVLATQRPSVEVITGLIKANITSRISFQVTSQVDSRTILDTSGAEKLLGAGDLLFLSSKSSKITRIQAPYIPEKEVKKVTDWIADNAKSVEETQPTIIQSLRDALEANQPGEGKVGGGAEDGMFFGDDDPLFDDVKRIVLETQKASASFLQRRLRIGYSRAARLIDMLEDKGIVGPADGAKPREVYGEPGTSRAPIEAQEASTQAPQEAEEPEGGWQKV